MLRCAVMCCAAHQVVLSEAQQVREHVGGARGPAGEQRAPHGEGRGGHVLVSDAHRAHVRARDHLVARGQQLQRVEAAAHVTRGLAGERLERLHAYTS